jgi:predicted enzyme related to lactoylglutathione lyase
MINGCPIAAVLVHVPSVAEALDWYERALAGASRRHLGEPWNFDYLDVGGIMVEIVPSDSKVRSGQAGSVVYWRALNFSAALEHLVSLGGTLYRGPIDIDAGQAMAQVLDPWGNCVGIRGPRTS